MAKIFRKGNQIKTVAELMECRVDGTGYVYYGDRPLAFSFIGHMNLFTVIGGIAAGKFFRAIRRGNDKATQK